jgi:site-specific DNA-methyltransferase (adenine-specific)
MPHFNRWFGKHQVWPVLLCNGGGYVLPAIWVVQTKEQQPIGHPNNVMVRVTRGVVASQKRFHPCPKSVEELRFLVEHLTKPNDSVLDCFCGLGSTLVAAQQLGRRWIGCELSLNYARRAKFRLLTQQQKGKENGDLLALDRGDVA